VHNSIGQLWQKFNRFYSRKKDTIKNLVSESGYELWLDSEDAEDNKEQYIFVGVEVSKLTKPPLELVARILPSTKYAVFTLKGNEIKSDWPTKSCGEWLTAAGLKRSHKYIIEFYDSQRFKGIDDPTSELDIYVPVK
jgi:predicted transcriptional regulator YdeE